jgi:hypothetical protein
MRSIRMGTPTTVKGIRTRALAVFAAVALLTLSLGVGVASADGRRDHGSAEATFTKWITGVPNVAGDVADMAGVVGGDVGGGSYAGEVLKWSFGTTTVIEALYHFNGSRHAFAALVHIVQTGSTAGSKAVINGVVTDGWLQGNQVDGSYTQITCPEGTCYQGTLDILRGSGD